MENVKQMKLKQTNDNGTLNTKKIKEREKKKQKIPKFGWFQI